MNNLLWISCAPWQSSKSHDSGRRMNSAKANTAFIGIRKWRKKAEVEAFPGESGLLRGCGIDDDRDRRRYLHSERLHRGICRYLCWVCKGSHLWFGGRQIPLISRQKKQPWNKRKSVIKNIAGWMKYYKCYTNLCIFEFKADYELSDTSMCSLGQYNNHI